MLSGELFIERLVSEHQPLRLYMLCRVGFIARHLRHPNRGKLMGLSILRTSSAWVLIRTWLTTIKWLCATFWLDGKSGTYQHLISVKFSTIARIRYQSICLRQEAIIILNVIYSKSDITEHYYIEIISSRKGCFFQKLAKQIQRKLPLIYKLDYLKSCKISKLQWLISIVLNSICLFTIKRNTKEYNWFKKVSLK